MWEIVACGGFNIETLVGLSVLTVALTVGAPSTRKFKDPFCRNSYKHNLERLKEKEERNATEEAATPGRRWR